MKTVFSSREISHVWANSAAPYGKSPGNLSFDHDVIRSYGTVIGRRIRDRNRTAYVLDRASFSVTTSKSQGRVWGAIPDTIKTFFVVCGERGQTLDFNGMKLAKHYEQRAQKLADEMPSRLARIRAEQYRAVTALYVDARDALAFFGYGTARLDAILAKRKADEANAAAILKTQAAKMTAAKLAKQKRELKERTEQNTARAKRFLAGEFRDRPYDPARNESAVATLPEPLRTKFLAAVTENNARLEAEAKAKLAATVAEWRAGKAVDVPYDSPVVLRAFGGELETSKGARVPLTDAERTFRFISARRQGGWHRNGETHAVGHYQLDAVNEAGVVVGCHRVSWGEIEFFASAMGWGV
jgi:hypothetical protein